MKPRMNTKKHKGLMILFSVVCLLPSALQAATQVIRYVDPDAAGAGNGTSWADAYTSLSAWEAAEQKNLVTADEQHTVYCRSSAGTQDTTYCTIAGWTTDATRFVEIIGDDFPADGIFDGTKYVLAHDGSVDSAALRISIDYIRVIGLQVEATNNAVPGSNAIVVSSVGATTDIRISNCISKAGAVMTGSGASYGIAVNDSTATVKIWNCVVYSFRSASAPLDTGFAGIAILAAGTIDIYNCTVFNCNSGILRAGGTVTAKNCAVCNSLDDFAGTITIDYCASDDGDGTNAQNFTAEATDWNLVFTDTTSRDFRLLDYTTSPCAVGKGTDDPGAGLYSDDIIGTARSSTWDIGAFEGPPPPGGGQPIIIEME